MQVGLYARRYGTIDPDAVYRLAMVKLNTSPAVLEVGGVCVCVQGGGAWGEQSSEHQNENVERREPRNIQSRNTIKGENKIQIARVKL